MSENNESAELCVERLCSCELSVNAKGDVSYKVKSYDETLEKAIENAFAGRGLVERKLKAEAPSEDGAK